MMPGMKLITLFLPVPWIKQLDGLVADKKYADRADVIRAAVRDLLKVEVWEHDSLGENHPPTHAIMPPAASSLNQRRSD